MIQVSEESATFAWKKCCPVRKLLQTKVTTNQSYYKPKLLQTKVKSFVMTFFGLKLVS